MLHPVSTEACSCSRSLMIGASQGVKIFDAETVRKAVEDTQLE